MYGFRAVFVVSLRAAVGKLLCRATADSRACPELAEGFLTGLSARFRMTTWLRFISLLWLSHFGAAYCIPS
jgi:hypothetical protein